MISKDKSANKKRVYLDYASATPIDGVVKKAFLANINQFGNAQSIYKEGVASMKMINQARDSIAKILNSSKREIIFTSGGTESNNLAILGLFNEIKKNTNISNHELHVVTSLVEHKSVLEPIKYLESIGVEVTYLRPNARGGVAERAVRESIKENTFLVSLMYVNNETGSVNDIKRISRVVKSSRESNLKKGRNGAFPYFHTDACQAPFTQSLRVDSLGVDLMTINSAKVYSFSGVGILYVRKGVLISPIIYGGGQEMGLRSGRENPLLISSFALALERCNKDFGKNLKKVSVLKDYFIKKFIEIFPDSIQNSISCSHIINFCVPNLDSELAVIQMDTNGVSVSSSSSCMNTSRDSYSYVVSHINQRINCSKESLRFSFGFDTKKSDLAICLKVLYKVKLLQDLNLKNKIDGTIN